MQPIMAASFRQKACVGCEDRARSRAMRAASRRDLGPIGTAYREEETLLRARLIAIANHWCTQFPES
jgi:hypothetical protein